MEEVQRSLTCVEDRPEACVVRKNFNHFCVTHRQPTCATKAPPHCAWKGTLKEAKHKIHIEVFGAQKKTYTLVPGKKYCEECMGQTEQAFETWNRMGLQPGRTVHMNKIKPAEASAPE
jgi:hypothetical protein